LRFQTVSLGAKPVDVVEHPLKKDLGSGGCNPCPLELDDLLALASYLGTHALDFVPNEINVRHVSRLETERP